MRKFLLAIDSVFGKIEFVLVCLFLSAILVLSFSQVILRNFFSAGVPAMDLMGRYLVLWIALMGAALATREKRNLSIEVLNRLVPGAFKKYLNSVLLVICAVAGIFITMSAYNFMLSESEEVVHTLWGVRSIYLNMVIPIGFLLITFHFFVQLVTGTGKMTAEHLPSDGGEEK